MAAQRTCTAREDWLQDAKYISELTHHIINVVVLPVRHRALAFLTYLVNSTQSIAQSLLLLGNFELSVVQSGITHGVTEKCNSTSDVCLEASEVHVGELAVDIAFNAASHGLDFFGKGSL